MDRDTELIIVRQLREEDPAAFDAVYEEYRARLFSFLVRLSRRWDLAEDLVEETWLRLATNARRLRPDTRLGPWLFTVARNLYFSACRSRLLEETCAISLIGLWPVASPGPSPFEQAAASELERRVERALATLPAHDREVLLLVGVEGYTAADAAAIAGVSPGTLRQRLSRARTTRSIDGARMAARGPPRPALAADPRTRVGRRRGRPLPDGGRGGRASSFRLLGRDPSAPPGGFSGFLTSRSRLDRPCSRKVRARSHAMTQESETRSAVGAQRYDWLKRQADDWQARGLVSPEQAGRILALYSPVGRFSAARAAFGLTGLAVLMAAVALLLVIGYNWDALAPAARVAIVFSIVGGTFAASAVAYRRDHARVGEALAFAATLLYGNGIFLLAGVFHIRAHDPDGLFWWMAGTLVTALLLRSKLITLTALALLLFWVPFEGAEYARPNYWFLPAAAAAWWLAVRLRSARLVALTAAIAALWLLVTGAFAFDEGMAAFGPVVALGAAYLAIGRRGSVRGQEEGLGNALVVAGLGTIFVSLLPLMSVGVHEGIDVVASIAWPTIAITALLAALGAGLTAASGRARSDWAILAAAGFALVWLAVVTTVDVDRGVAIALAVGASALALAFAVWLMRDGARQGSLAHFGAGALFALGFVAVRWASAVGNLLWSALILGLASAGLLWMAWLWRARSRVNERNDPTRPDLSERPSAGSGRPERVEGRSGSKGATSTKGA